MSRSHAIAKAHDAPVRASSIQSPLKRPSAVGFGSRNGQKASEAAVWAQDMADMASPEAAIIAASREAEVKLEVPVEAVPPIPTVQAMESARPGTGVAHLEGSMGSGEFGTDMPVGVSGDREGLRIAAERGATLALIGSRPSGIGRVSVQRVEVGRSKITAVMHVDTSDILTAGDASSSDGSSKAAHMYEKAIRARNRGDIAAAATMARGVVGISPSHKQAKSLF